MITDEVAIAESPSRASADVWLGLVALTAAAIRLAAALSSFFGDYYVLPLGELIVAAVFLGASAAVLVRLWRHPETSRVSGMLMCAVAAVVFLVGAWYVVVPTTAMLAVSLVAVLRVSPRNEDMVAAVSLVLGLGAVLLVCSLAVTAVSAWLGGVTPYAVKVSPNGMLVLRARSLDPGAMGSTSMDISVEPRYFPVLGKRLYVGDGVWAGDEPDARWQGDWMVEIGGQAMSVLDPSREDFAD